MEKYEQRYKEALERAKYMHEQGMMPERLEYVFPELKESEDERIWTINYLNNRKLNSSIIEEKESLKKAIAWLEKQGEQKDPCETCDHAMLNCINFPCKDKQNKQKSTDKAEPKFKVGDWIVDTRTDKILQIQSVNNNGYDCTNGDYFSNSVAYNYRLWTIQDAKDGDVLLFEGNYNSIVLFHGIGINGKGRINYHCKCDLGNYSFGVQGNTAYLGTIEENAEHYHPATKEQRDLLFQKMKEAGYEWDVEKKELKKTEQKHIWSKEDEVRATQIISDLEKCFVPGFPIFIDDIELKINWLKSLIPQNRWKPSEEQLTILKQQKR